MSKKALQVGINYIGQSGELSGCINDVENVNEVLLEHYNFKSENIRILRDDDEKNMPTKQNIIDGIKWLTDGAKEGDVLFFQYSGHGSNVRDERGPNHDEEDGKDEVLVPLDYQRSGIIKDDKLRKLLGDDVPEGVKVVCLVDSCHSGTILDLKFKYSQSNNKEVIKKDDHYKKTKCDIIVYSGCKDKQTSADTYVKQFREYAGALTGTLLIVLAQNDYKISHRKLISKTRKQLQAGGYSQVPQLTFGKRISLDDSFDI